MKRTFGQRSADWVTEFSGSWPFILWSVVLGVLWVLLNISKVFVFDPYPFLFLNWVLTVISTLQSPLIMLSQNRQNETDRERVEMIVQKLDAISATMIAICPKSHTQTSERSSAS